MPFKTTITRYELRGNAKDGFDTNNFFNVFSDITDKPMPDRALLTEVKNQFEGCHFVFTENRYTNMVRRGITLQRNSNCDNGMLLVYYRGHMIGEVNFEEVG